MAGISAERMRSGGDAIVVAAGAAALALAALCLALAGTGLHGTKTGLRATAVLAFPFLASAYAAPALAVLWPGAPSERLLLRRRSLWLAFAAVFAVHLFLVVRLLTLPSSPGGVGIGLVPGVVAYAFLAGMVLASLGGLGKALGSARVRFLLRVGEHWVFAVFTLGLFKGAVFRHAPLWLAPLAIMLAVYVLRFKAWGRESAAPLAS